MENKTTKTILSFLAFILLSGKIELAGYLGLCFFIWAFYLSISE